MNQTRINFVYNDTTEDTSTSVGHAVQGEKAEFLPSIIEEFVTFLKLTGFSYLSGEVIAVPGGYLILKEDADLEEIAEVLDPQTYEGAQLDFFVDAEAPEPVEVAEKPALKVGDRVRVVTDTYGESQKGDIGFVIDTEGVCFPVEVDFTKPGSIKKQPGSTNSYDFADLEVIEGFIVGDRVTVNSSQSEGEVGVITEDDGSGFLQVSVDFDKGGSEWCETSELSFA